MNKIYKVIWNKAKNSYVVVSEIVKRNGKSNSSLNKKIIAAFLAAGTALSVTGSAWAASYEAGGGSASPFDAVAIGAGSKANGVSSTVVGAGSQINNNVTITNQSLMYQGATASVYGVYNTIGADATSAYDGVANSIIGVANMTNQANGSLIFGAGNLIQNAYGDVTNINDITAAGRDYMSSRTDENFEKLQTALNDSVATSGGNVMVVGGANKAGKEGKVSFSQLMGVSNELKSGNYNYLDGYKNVVDGDYNIAIGTEINITADESVVIGKNGKVESRDGSGSFVLGNNASATFAKSVALGSDSVADREAGKEVGYDVAKGAAYSGKDSDSATWTSTLGAVSVGAAEDADGKQQTRQIINVAAGSADTDAVNVAQLKAAYVDVKSGDNIINVETSYDDEDGHATYTITSKADGKVASGDTGIVSGDTIYNETRVKKDGNYIKKDNTAAENITALDAKVQDNATRIDNINNQFGNLDNRMKKGLAGAAALAALHPMDFNPDDKLQFSAGVGNYRGETAAAVGAFYRPDESVMFSIGGTFGNSDNMVNAGITFGLDGTRNRITRSRTAMAREIQDLRSLVTQMAARMDRLEGVNAETAMFPDVPENHWAYEYVEDLQKRGALKGYPDGLFKGDRAMTRYEFAAMLDRLVRSGVMLDSKIAKEFEPELGRIYVERISGQDNDRKKVERVRVNNSDSKYPEGKTRDVYGSKIVTEVSKTDEAK